MSKKQKNDGSKKRKQQPWKTKQIGRIERAIKVVAKIRTHVGAARPPGVEPERAQNAETQLLALHAQVSALENGWKPAKGRTPGTSKKVGIGSIVMVRTDLDRTESKFFKAFPAECFTNAVVMDDDGKYWMVKCSDGVTRLLGKKFTVKVPETAEATATAEAA